MTESYCAKIKSELCAKTAREFGFTKSEDKTQNDCCKLSFFCALLLFGCKKKGDALVFNVKNAALADLFASSAAAFYSLSPELVGEKVTVKLDAALERIYRAASLETKMPALPIFVCDDCQSHFLRGAFLCAGTVSSPEKTQQLNLFCEPLTREIKLSLSESEFSMRESTRRGHRYLYLKKSSEIADFLARIGAQAAALSLINREIERSVRADINRQNNFDTANISRASRSQSLLQEAIRTLEDLEAIDTLPESLKEVVRLQKAYPDDTLSELGNRLYPPLSKSGMHHRVKKIIDIANQKEL
ncbi:MAG: DNA-binding protein WhiA [Clostridia bacterium]|nr:DNA-binding protein WhiA [Clostridia bacterium]